LEAPVLFIGFNRPEVSLQTFDYIRKAKPTKLYIAIDGPRADKPGEEKLVAEVKKIVENVDWPCETHYKYNETNKGAEITVSSAISWVFETEEYAIILEDDIVAPLSFFKFAQEMLMKYKDDDRFCIVTSNNYTPIKLPNDEDYFFAKYGHTWGWATWKRAWKDYDLNKEIKDEHLDLQYLSQMTNTRKEALYYKKLFTRLKSAGKGNNTWDYMRVYTHFVSGQLSIIPSVNLSSNIGVVGLHARGKTDSHYRLYDENFTVRNHPSKIDCNIEFDKHHFKKHINPRSSLTKRAYKKAMRILKLK